MIQTESATPSSTTVRSATAVRILAIGLLLLVMSCFTALQQRGLVTNQLVVAGSMITLIGIAACTSRRWLRRLAGAMFLAIPTGLVVYAIIANL